LTEDGQGVDALPPGTASSGFDVSLSWPSWGNKHEWHKNGISVNTKQKKEVPVPISKDT